MQGMRHNAERLEQHFSRPTGDDKKLCAGIEITLGEFLSMPEFDKPEQEIV